MFASNEKDTRNNYKHSICLPSAKHPLTSTFLRSNADLIVERHRHFMFTDGCILHPLSMFSLVWTALLTFVMAAHIVMTSFKLCFEMPRTGPQTSDWVLCSFNFLCIIDVIVQINTGMLDHLEKEILLNRRQVVIKNLKGFMLIDLVSSLPLTEIFLIVSPEKQQMLLATQLLSLLKITRIPKIVYNIHMLAKVWFESYVGLRLLRVFLFFLFYLHISTCLMYIVTAVRYYITGIETTDYNTFLRLEMKVLSEIPMSVRYRRALFVGIATFFGAGFSMYKVRRPDEIIVAMFIISTSTVFIVYITVLMMELYLTSRNSKTRYHEMMDQVEKYMSLKQFPVGLRHRVQMFYKYRFQKKYYREATVLSTLSEHLRHEISMHTCRRLVTHVAALNGLPPGVLGAVLACLKPQLYLPGDIVIRAGDHGDNMFFIGSGTLAVYTAHGNEICHLEDGAHFGEIALLVKDNKRTATVVAIEMTELYKLTQADYRRFVASYVLLYKRLEKLAAARIAQTVYMEQQHKEVSESQDTGNRYTEEQENMNGQTETSVIDL